MVIDQGILDSLEAKTQLHFFKHFNDLASKRIGHLEEREKELSSRNDRLMTDIYHQRTQRTADLQDSEMIQGILKKVPKLPTFANNLMSDMMNDQISAAQLAEETQKDPPLVGIVLKTINSSYYGFQKKISDIQHAITLLGFSQLYQLISSEGVRQTMPDLPEFKELHFHCMAISQIAFTLSEAKRLAKPAQMATIGLLHDLGQIVILLLKQQNPKLAGLLDTLDRAQVGGMLLKSWSLPDVVWQSIEYQFYPEFSPPDNIPAEIKNKIAILYIAHLCYEHYQGKTEDQLPTTFLSEYKQLLKLERYSLAEIAHGIVLPGLMKKINALPAPLRKLIKAQAEDDVSVTAE
jgi:HD-like signal output (HDOD) protein